MLSNGRVATRLPAQDLERARAFYSEKLGLDPVEERPGGLLYRCGDSEFALFRSAGAPSGAHTQMGWEVDDIGEVAADLGGGRLRHGLGRQPQRGHEADQRKRGKHDHRGHVGAVPGCEIGDEDRAGDRRPE